MRVAVIPTCLFLRHKYISQYDEEIATPLAAAVTNALFGVPPANELGRQFLISHENLVDSALSDISQEPEICYIVSLFAHVKANIAGNTSTLSGEQLLLLKKLRDLQILFPIDQIKMPNSIDDLFSQAHAFDLSVIRQLATTDT